MVAINFVESLKSTWTPKTLPAADFLQQQRDRWGRPSFNRCETLLATDEVIPYLDYDTYIDHQPTKEDHDKHLRLCLEKLGEMFHDPNVFDLARDVRVGHSHGWVPQKQTYKVSLRFWVPAFSIAMGDMPLLINYWDQGDFWDTSPYHARQKLRVPGACKGEGDERVLELAVGTPPEECLAQNVRPGSRHLGNFEPVPRSLKRRRLEDAPGISGANEPFDWEEAKRALVDFGFDTPVKVGVREDSITFTSADKGLDCPLGCGRAHDSQNNWVMQNDDGSFKAKNYSEFCRMRRMGSPSGGTPKTIVTPDEVMDVLVPLGQAQQRLQTILAKSVGAEVSLESVLQTAYGFDFRITPNPDTPCRHCGNPECLQHYQCHTLVPPCCEVIPYDKRCKQVLVGWENSAVLQNLLLHPTKDVSYIEIFRMHQEGLGTFWVWDGGRWFMYAGVVWEQKTPNDLTQHMQTALVPIIDALIDAFGRMTTQAAHALDKRSKELWKSLNKLTSAKGYLQKASNMDSIVATANRNLLYDSTFAKKLDLDKSLCGCPSGIINLETGELSQGAKDLYVSKKMGAAYRGLELPTPDVDDFFNSIFNEDQDVIDYMQRFLGYCCTAHTKEQVFAIFHGAGANGKGVLNQMLAAVMGGQPGGYYCSMHRDCLFNPDKRGSKNQASPHLAELEGKRLGVTDESADDDKLDVSLVKLMSGETAINCRFMRENNRSFMPTHKALLMTNSRPRLNPDDKALLRRLVLVPFSNIYKRPEDVDPTNPHHRPMVLGLVDKLTSRDCLEQFLTWLVRGAVAWHQVGLGEKPGPLQAAQKQYVQENDQVADFLNLHCRQNRGGRSDTTEVREAFQTAYDVRVSAADFKKQMGNRGFRISRQRLPCDGKLHQVFEGLELVH